MKEITNGNFGLLIAFLLPGFITLWGLSYLHETLRFWLGASPTSIPTVGGFLYITVASVAAGLTVSTIRWLAIDSLHHISGIREPNWNFSRLQKNIDGYDRLIEIHYRYYQFYANSLIALLIAYTAQRISTGYWSTPLGWNDLGFLFLVVIFFAGSRDTLKKYYLRTSQLLDLSEVEEKIIENDFPNQPE